MQYSPPENVFVSMSRCADGDSRKCKTVVTPEPVVGCEYVGMVAVGAWAVVGSLVPSAASCIRIAPVQDAFSMQRPGMRHVREIACM